MTKSRIRNSPEAKRWLIVGAYQAGATEKHVARISGLSRTAVRNIILNYQRTGTPCMPKKIPNKIRQKLVVEYDENGEIINTDDDEEEEQEVLSIKEPFIMKKRRSIIKKKNKVFKRKPSVIQRSSFSSTNNSTTNVTTKDIINYAMDQMRITDNNNHINTTAQNLINQQEQSSPCLPPLPSSSSSWHNLSSPPYQQHYHHQQQVSSSSVSTNTAPLQQTTIKTTKKPKIRLPPPSKFDQNIRGYELWTHDDDMVLLNHVLDHLHGGGWSELEIRFNGRHSARLCYDRWKHLKSLLLKGITDKPNTPW